MSKNNRARRKHKLVRRADRNKRRRVRPEPRSATRTLTPTFEFLPNPFDALSDDARRRAIEEIAGKNEERYQAALSGLRAVLRRHDPLLVLSIMASYGQGIPVDETAGVTKLDSDCEIYPFHLEILQALSLQIEPADLSRTPFGPDVASRVWETTKTLCDAHNFRRLDPAGMDLPEDEKTVALAQQLIRGATQAVRNWGYHSQIKRIARELYAPFDARLLGERGFTASDILDVFETILAEVESRQTTRLRALADLFRSSGTDQRLLVYNYYEMIGLESDETERFIERLDVEAAPLDAVRTMILSHYDLRLPEAYTLSASALAASLDVDDNRVNAILDEYALGWGALRGFETDRLHLSNPVWAKPIVKLGDGRYFCALPVGFFSFVIPCMETVLVPFAASVRDRRAHYLEAKVAEIVAGRFPGSATRRNLKWVDDGRTYETDLIAFIDSFALIIECKSGKVTPPALRGAPDRLRRHIEKLLVHPNQQSRRLGKRIEFLGSNRDAADPLRDAIGYDLAKVRRVVRVSVCLEDFGTIQCCLKQLEHTGWLPADFVPCPTMNLADFETVFDLLEHPVQILHYLMRREAVEASVGYHANELELLGLYLATLLDIGEIEPDVHLSMLDMSAPLDTYYNSRYALAYVMFKDGNAGKKRDFMEDAAAAALKSSHIRTVVVIAKNIDRDNAAYHAIALLQPHRPDSVDRA